MYNFPLFILDSGDPDEFLEIRDLAKKHGKELWGATTNPTLIAKKLAGLSTSLRVNKKVTQQEAFGLQKEIALEITSIVPGAVSVEVYADEKTPATSMAKQGREIASWHQNIVVKLPTTIEGFKARSILRKEKIPVNNTLVFSTQQIFAICLHEQIIEKTYGPIENQWPSFISPFVGRLDDQGQDGMQLVEQGMEIKKQFSKMLWMLTASVRRIEHLKRGSAKTTELITAPANVYREWFTTKNNELEIMNYEYAKELAPIPYWDPPQDLLEIQTEEAFMDAVKTHKLDIRHPLTDKGINRFVQDWETIITSF